MASKVSAVPEGFHTLTPHLTVRNASEALEFYKRAFAAEVLDVAHLPNGKIMHAALRIGDSMLMLNDEMEEYGALSPLATGGSGVTIHMYTSDADATYNRAVSSGAKVKMPLMDQFWGDRYGSVTDPYGHTWSIAARIKEMSPEEMKRASEEAMAGMPPPQAMEKTA